MENPPIYLPVPPAEYERLRQSPAFRPAEAKPEPIPLTRQQRRAFQRHVEKMIRKAEAKESRKRKGGGDST